MARPLKKLTDEQIKQVEKLAGYMTQEQVANFFGISLATFKNIKNRDDRVLSHYNKGKTEAIYQVANSLVQSALKGNTQAQVFFLKTKGGWSTDSIKIDTSIHDGRETHTLLENIINSILNNGDELDLKAINTIINLIKTKTELEDLKDLRERIECLENG